MPKRKQDEILYRTAEIVRDAVNEGERTADLAFSSETPVPRYFGDEILDHSPGSVDLTRLNSGGALLLNHNSDIQIGVVEQASIGHDRRGRARVRFGKSAGAEEVFNDVIDGIRKLVSVGYRIDKAEETKDGDKVTVRATHWTPFEISMVSVPADATVGIGRSQNNHTERKIMEKKEEERKEEKKETREIPKVEVREVDVQAIKDAAASEARTAELDRVRRLTSLGEKYGQGELARQMVESGKDESALRDAILDKMGTAAPMKASDENAEVGLSGDEAHRFSFLRLLRSLAKPGDPGLREAAAFEFECSAAVAQKTRKNPDGAYVPMDVLTRDLVVGTATAGGHLKATDLLTGSFIDYLRNRMIVNQLGAMNLTGLVGDVAIPRATGGATGYWVAESGAPTESQQAFDQVTLSPKTVGAFTDISRKLLQQSSLDVEAFVRRDLASTLALALDLAAINGSGSSNQPTGILNTSGIGDVAGGTNGLTPAFSHIVELESDVAVANADIGNLAYLTNAKVRGKLKQVEKASSTGQFVWTKGDTPGFGDLNGYRAAVSNQVPSNLTKGTSSVASAIIFGNFADLIIAMWGGLDINVDTSTGSTAGTVRIVALQDTDINVRHPESFSAMQDALTA